jgi:hypothetical protein
VARVIAVTDHAIEQHLERWPGDPWDKENRRFLIASEVSSALNDFRVSTREPAWSGGGKRKVGRTRNPKERDRSIRFAWTEDQGRVYLLDRQDGGRTIVVVTSILPNER